MRRTSALLAGGLLSAVAIAGCGSTGSTGAADTATPAVTVTATVSPTATASSTPSASSSATSVAVSRRKGLQQFQSPSGNLGCELDSSQARCDIKSHTWTAPQKPASCQLDYGNGLSVFGSHRGVVVCAGDTVLNPSAPTLDYGHAIEVGSFRCTSEVTGMTCVSTATGHGFFLARDSYRVY